MSVMASRRHWLRVVAAATADRLKGMDPAEATGLPEAQIADLAPEDRERIRWAIDDVRYRVSRIGQAR